MKKNIFILVFISFLFSYSFADYDNCTKEEDGIKLCFNIENKWNGDYEFDTKFYINAIESIPLKCEILTPNWYLERMNRCKWNFKYEWNDKSEVKIYTYIKDNRQLTNMDYQFSNLSSWKLSTVKLVYNKFDLIKQKIEEKNQKILLNQKWDTLSDKIKLQIWNYLFWWKTVIKNYDSFERLVIDYIKYWLLYK